MWFYGASKYAHIFNMRYMLGNTAFIRVLLLLQDASDPIVVPCLQTRGAASADNEGASV